MVLFMSPTKVRDALPLYVSSFVPQEKKTPKTKERPQLRSVEKTPPKIQERWFGIPLHVRFKRRGLKFQSEICEVEGGASKK